MKEHKFCKGCQRYVSIAFGFKSNGDCRVCLHSLPMEDGIVNRGMDNILVIAGRVVTRSRNLTFVVGALFGGIVITIITFLF